MSGPERLASLDALRGFAIASMVLVNNPGSWNHIHPPLAHAAWHGCTFTDLVFPFFLFAAGVAMTLSLGRRARTGADRPALLRTLARRAALIFLIGVALNLFPTFHWGGVRVMGVLQRIALTVLLAAPVVIWGRWRTVLAVGIALLTVHTALLLWVPAPGADGLVAAGRLEPGMDAGAWLDRMLLGGHLWKAGSWDPEGLLGTLPATASLLAGVLAGHLLAASTGRRPKWLGLLAAGLTCLALGLALDKAGLPLNKNLWTASFAVFTAGWSLLFLAAFHAALDEAPERLRAACRWACRPLAIYGVNALFMFVLSGVLGRLLQTITSGGVPLKARLAAGFARLPLSPENQSLAFAVAFNLVMFSVAWGMWRRKWIVKV